MTQNEKNTIIGKKIQCWIGIFFLIVPIVAVLGLIFYIPDELLGLNNTKGLWKIFIGNDISQVLIGLFSLVGAYLIKDNIQYLFLNNKAAVEQ